MLHEILIILSILTVINISTVINHSITNTLEQTLLSTHLLRTKYNAINNTETETLTIENKIYIEKNIKTEFEDCTLAWTANGTTSKSGTCKIGSKKLSLKVGEGGIGYPW